MPSRRLLTLALAASWAVVLPLHATEPAVTLARCAAHSPPLVGWRALHTHCPGVARALQGLGLEGLLPPRWHKTLDSRSLAALAALAQHYAAAPPSLRPDPAALSNDARALAHPVPAPTWWGRVHAWLRRWTAPLTAMLRDRLRALLHGHGRTQVLRVLLWLLVALLGALVAIGVWLGYRAGLFSPGRRRTVRSQRPALPTASIEPPASGPDWSTLGSQPSRVLRLLVDALISTGRLERERHLTFRELTVQARFDTPAQREEFAHVARLAEHERYGPPGVGRIPDTVLQRIPALHAQCSTPPREAAGEAR